mgnify:FL=1
MDTTQTAEREELASQLVEVNRGRASFYRMLAQLYFKELTAEQVKHLAGMDFSGMSGDDETIAEGYADIRRYLRHANGGTRQELACDYAHTFLAAGNYETFAATPYESVFTSEMGLLMQEARDEVYKTFCSQHIPPDESLHLPEDHISFEFEFVATMLDRINDAILDGAFGHACELAQVVSDFHRDHQLNWIDDLCDSVDDVAQTRFYKGVGKVTRGFVHADTEVIADEIDALRELAEPAAA